MLLDMVKHQHGAFEEFFFFAQVLRAFGVIPNIWVFKICVDGD